MMTATAKLWISALVVILDIGLVLYLASTFSSDPAIIIGLGALMVLSSMHVVLIIWFGEKWWTSPDFRTAIRRLTMRPD